MSTMQRLTLIGMYNYDPTLFDGLTLPDQYDKSIFIDSLLIEHGEKCVLYSDLDFMKFSIGAWGRKWSLELTRIAEALFAEYNPIWNYDRYEDINDVNARDRITNNINDSDSVSATSAGSGRTTQTDTTNDSASESQTSNVGSSETSTANDLASATTNSNTSNSNTSSATDAASNHTLLDYTDYQDKQTNDFDIETDQTSNGTVEHQVSADNDSSYQPASKDITDAGTIKESNDGTITHDIKGDKDKINEDTVSNTVSSGTTSESGSGASNSVESGTGSSSTDETSAGAVNTVESGTGSSKTTESGNNNEDTTSHSEGSSKTNDSDNYAANHNGHMWGNIGVTTAASMVTEVTLQRMKFNLYNTACRLFANELLIGIY